MSPVPNGRPGASLSVTVWGHNIEGTNNYGKETNKERLSPVHQTTVIVRDSELRIGEVVGVSHAIDEKAEAEVAMPSSGANHCSIVRGSWAPGRTVNP